MQQSPKWAADHERQRQGGGPEPDAERGGGRGERRGRERERAGEIEREGGWEGGCLGGREGVREQDLVMTKRVRGEKEREQI